MSLSQEQILDMAKEVTAVIEFSEDMLGKRTYNAVMKALNQGYIPTRTGVAAKYYNLLTSHYKMPRMVFSRGARWWDGVHLHSLPDECAEPLSEFWAADRVLYRMEHPEEYSNALAGRQYSGIRDAINEPDYKKLVRQSRENDYTYMRILSTKDVMYFDAIASKYLGTADYKAKLEAAKQMMQGGTMTFKLKGD